MTCGRDRRCVSLALHVAGREVQSCPSRPARIPLCGYPYIVGFTLASGAAGAAGNLYVPHHDGAIQGRARRPTAPRYDGIHARIPLTGAIHGSRRGSGNMSKLGRNGTSR
jgi:hypothetical protein